MKYQILYCALFLATSLSVNTAHAQDKRYAFEEIKPGCDCPEFEQGITGFDLKSVSKFSDFAIVFHINATWYDQMRVTIVRKDGKYIGNFYHKMADNFQTPISLSTNPYNYKKFELDQGKLDSIVHQLLAHQITTLPMQRDIYKKGFLTLYHISYKMAGEKGSFSFGPPADPMREYPDEMVYQHYDAILNMFWNLISPMYNQVRKDISQELEAYRLKEERDTIFLRKPNAEGHAVYVDKAGDESPYFATVTNLDYTLADKSYLRAVKALKKYNKTVSQSARPQDLPENWVQLHVYKGKYYVYSPSNGDQLKLSLNDSTMIVKEMKRSVRLISDVQQMDKNIYQIQTIDKNGLTLPFKIQWIHKSRGIAVFEDLFGKGSQVLMVSLERADRFPLVINYSPNHMEPEFVFDIPDYHALLNPKPF